MVKIIIITVITILIVFLIRLIITKDRLKNSENLYTDFYNMVQNKGKGKIPNNAKFNDLFKIVYKEARPNVTIQNTGQFANQNAIYVRKVGILESFPSLHPQLIESEISYLSNLKDYFKERFDENFSIAFWIKIYVFLPSNFIKYLGWNERSALSGITNIIYWLILATIPYLSQILK